MRQCICGAHPRCASSVSRSAGARRRSPCSWCAAQDCKVPHAQQAYLNTLHARYEDWLFTKSVDPMFNVPVLVRRRAP